MPEPDWKTDLADVIDVWVSGNDFIKRSALASVLVHVDAAYQRGLVAGRSQSGYRTTRKKKETEERCTPTAAPSAASPSPASTTEAGEP